MSSNVKANSLFCHIVARKYGFIRFKTLKDLWVFAVEGEDELHIYDAYRVDLQIQQEFTLEVKRWKARLGIISHMQGKTRFSVPKCLTFTHSLYQIPGDAL
jgi:hypothetical protein